MTHKRKRVNDKSVILFHHILQLCHIECYAYRYVSFAGRRGGGVWIAHHTANCNKKKKSAAKRF